jgi:DNA repair exonuclease SbcCD ATPase subunit
MKAALKTKDIGGLAGSHCYEFESGKLNIIESSNSGGKTSVVRALTSVLSIPKGGQFDENTLNEAFKLGIKTDPRNPSEGFVNIHATKAEISLEIDGRKENYAVDRNGEYIQFPETGDQRFLLTGILSNDSRVIRQLHGMEDFEPDDFKWAVTLLSNAKRYDLITEKLANVREDIGEKQIAIERTIAQMERLNSNQSTLQNKLERLDRELADLRPRFSGIEPLLEKRSKIGSEIDNLIVRTGDKRGEIAKITREQLEIPKQKIEKATERKLQLKDALDRLKISELETVRNLEGPAMEREISRVRDRRGEVDGLLNLFVVADSSFHQHREAKAICPLCGNGHLDTDHIKEQITVLRDEKQTLNNKIIDLTRRKSGLDRDLEEQKSKAQSLKEELANVEADIYNAKESMRNPERAVRSIESTISGYEHAITEKKALLADLTKSISKSDEQVNKEYTEKETERTDTSLELGKILQQIGQLSSIEIMGITIEPKKAQTVCKELFEELVNLIAYTERRAEEERQEAAKQFNENIQSLMKNLGFKDFKEIQLNRDYRLYVERHNPTTNDYVRQQPQTMSTSEKLAVALVLQLALKETYMKHVPFFILDDIIEDFDEERIRKVNEYLAQKAKNEDLFVIITKLVEETGLPQIRYISK